MPHIDHPFTLRALPFIMMVSLIPASASALISEIMYDPGECSDSFCEWIELSSDHSGTLNLTGWQLCNKTLLPGFVSHATGQLLANTTLLLPPDAFALITDGNSGTDVYNFFTVSPAAFALHVDAGSLCGGLGSSGALTLTNSSGTVMETVSYSSSQGASNNNKTLEWSGSYWGESLVAHGTPGAVNSIAGLSNDTAFLAITEFLPSPIGGDDAPMPQGEWVELYNPGSTPVDARGLVLYDSNDDNELFISDTKTLTGTVIPPRSYLVVYRSGDSDFALNNDGYDEVRLFADSSRQALITSTSYSGSADGMSWSNLSGIWALTAPTPGAPNTPQASCDWRIDVIPAAAVFTAGNALTWDVTVRKNYGLSTTATVKGMIEDPFGRVVKTYQPWTNETIALTRTQSFSPNLAQDTYIIRFWIDQLGCADDNPADNADSTAITVSPHYRQEEPSLEIREIYDLGNDGKAEWGDTFRVKLSLYKGNDTKETAQLWLEDSSERKASRVTKVSLVEDFTNLTATLPVQLLGNCGRTLPDGTYHLILEGLGKRDEERITIAGFDRAACGQEQRSAQRSAFSFELQELPRTLTSGRRFDVQLRLTGDDKEHDVEVWSYAFRGSKSYSGEREQNKKTVHLNPGEEKHVTLPVMLDSDLEPGHYQLKLRLRKDGQKTAQELTEPITITAAAGKITNFELLETDGNSTMLSVRAEAPPTHTLGLVSFFGEQQQPVNSSEATFHVPLIEANNIFFAKLLDEESNIVDVSQLSVRYENGEVREVAQRIDLRAESEQLLRDRLKALRGSAPQPGRVIYESSSWKARELAPWFFITALSLLAVVVIFKKL